MLHDTVLGEETARHADVDYARDFWLPGELDPADITLRRVPAWGIALTLRDERSWLGVRLVRAFPLSQPDEYIAVLNRKNDEIGTLLSLAGLDPESHQIAMEELAQRYLVHQVQKVYSLRCEGETLYWDVETQRGRRECVVKADRETLIPLDARRLLLIDVDGNRFELADVTRLDGYNQEVINQVL
jgi:hypothetical protein